MSFGMRPSSIRRTSPNQRSLRCLSRVYIVGRPARDIIVGYFVLSGYVQDTADASQVECVKPSLLPGICSPCLAAIQQRAGNTGIADRHLCLHRELGACHTRAVRRARVEAAFPILLSISASKERLSVMVEPR